MGQQFGGDHEFDQGFQKRGRFEGPDEGPSVPPATLRILVRQHDAGGIIGKVCVGAQFTESNLYMFIVMDFFALLF